MKVLKFGAVWCSGCIIMKPIWEEIEEENPWLETKYYDVDENEQMAKKFNIEHHPCFVFLDKEGNEIDRLHGEIKKEKLVEKIEELKDK